MDLLREARRLYASGRMHDALEAAQAACDHRPKDAEAWLLLARVSRHADLPGASDDAFRRAAALAKKLTPPARVDRPRFEAMVAEASERLSPDARRRLAGARVRVAGLPTAEEVRSGTDPDALSRRERGPEDVLTLYQVNLENQAASEAALQALVTRTLSRA